MNELVKQEAQMPVVGKAMLEEMGISQKDVSIPFLSLGQLSSKFVDDGLAKQGDIFMSQENRVLGSYDKPVEIIPVRVYKIWREFEKVDGGQKFIRQYPVTSANERQDWEFMEDGKPMKRYYTYNFVVLLVSDCEKGEPRPYIVSFYSTSMGAGRKITSHYNARLQLNKSHLSHTFLLMTKKMPGKKGGSYAVYDVQKHRENPFMDESAACYQSLPSNTVAADKLQGDNSELEKDAEVVKDDQEF